MTRSSACVAIPFVVALWSTSCTESQQDRAQKRADEAKKEAQKLGREMKNGAQKMARDVNREAGKVAEKARSSGVHTDADHVDDKLRAAGEDARAAGSELKTGAAELALTARVKTALANDAGLKTVTDISVSANGSVVTLSGNVLSEADRARAVDTTSHVPGVTRVVSHLSVRPPS